MQTDSKLQEITQKLYEEGLSKGKAEGERILKEAKEQALKHKQEAMSEIEAMRKAAEMEMEKEKENAQAELKRAMRQMISSLKIEIEEELLSKTIEGNIATSFNEKEFVKDMMIEAVRSFGKGDNIGSDLEIIIPQSMLKDYDSIIKSEFALQLKEGMSIKSEKNLNAGFEIVCKEKGYKLSFTEEDFIALIKQYAGDKLKKWLF